MDNASKLWCLASLASKDTVATECSNTPNYASHGAPSPCVQAYEGECSALRDECRAISEDLEVLVKENQVVNHQLTTTMTER